MTWKEFGDQVAGVAKGLIASGVAAGDRVALQAKTRYEWTVIDFAIWTAGAVTVPIYETSSADQVAWILSDSGATAVIVERDEHATAVESVRDQAPDLKSVHVIDDDAVGTLTQAGKDVPDSELEARRATLKADSVATLIYTSGTTGRPKGCELTHCELPVRDRQRHEPARPVPQRRGLAAAVHPAGPRAGPRHPGRRRQDPHRRRAHPGREEPRRRPRRVQADVRARRPARVREGLQHREGQGRGRRQGQDLRQGRPGGHRLVAGAQDTGGPGIAAEGPARPVRQAGLRQAARRARRPLPRRHLRRRAAGRPARPLLPRHRRHRLRGLRPHRDHRRRLGQPRRRRCASAPSAGRCPASTSRSPTTARCSSAAAS